jgi:hypothetical protein
MKLAKKRIKLWLVALKGTGGWGLKEKSRPTPILQSPIGGKKKLGISVFPVFAKYSGKQS